MSTIVTLMPVLFRGPAAFILMSKVATNMALGRYSRAFGCPCPVTMMAAVVAHTVSGRVLLRNVAMYTGLAAESKSVNKSSVDIT